MVLLSGGIDSATSLYFAKRDGYSTRALTIRIHGTATGELDAARNVARTAPVLEHRFMSVPELKEARDIRRSVELSRGTVPATYIPLKNAIFYSLAAAYAEETGAGVIIGGHNADDERVFEDVRDEFFSDLERTLSAASPRLRRNELTILRPLRDMTKPEVIAVASKIGVPLRLTWSCHRGGTRHCWKCEGCRQRTEAFAAAGVKDPLRPKRV